MIGTGYRKDEIFNSNMAQHSLLKGKHFFCREWAFAKFFHCLETRSTSKTCGLLITGGPGCGKTALCCEMVWPTVGDENNARFQPPSQQSWLYLQLRKSSYPMTVDVATYGKRFTNHRPPTFQNIQFQIGKQHALSKYIVAHHFCEAHNIDTLSVTQFIHSLVDQFSLSDLIHGYKEKLNNQEVTEALKFSACEKNPDEAFKQAILYPLMEVDCPKHACILLIDSIDESYMLQISNDKSAEEFPNVTTIFKIYFEMIWTEIRYKSLETFYNGSRTIGELISNYHQLFPQWLLLVTSARKQSKSITRMFTGFRKLTLDDLKKSNVVRDVQQYILSRLDREDSLRQHLSHGVANNFIMLREIKEIPGTLNGLYLWLCQRIFTRKQFAKIQPVLNVLLAARKPLTEEEIYQCVWTRNINMTKEDFNKRLNLISKILIDGSNTTKILFHHSFAEWLLDVKHCTQKYLCRVSEGHGMTAMRYSTLAESLNVDQVCDFALHLSKINVSEPLKESFIPLWMLMCGTTVETSLEKSIPCEEKVLKLLLDAGAQTDIKSKSQAESESKESDPITALLDGVNDLNDKDLNQRTLLHCATYESNCELIEALILRGADVEVIDRNGQTALNLASRQGDVSIVTILLNSGKANPDQADNEGWTPLRSAAWGGNTKVVEALLEHGAQVENADSDGRTALRAAAWGGHDDIVTKLLEHNAVVNNVDNEGRTALIAAAYMGHAEIVEHLLNNEAEINHEDADGRTALSVAALCAPASEGHSSVVNLLLERGSEVDHKDHDGMTPLLVAAFEGHREVCELLLESDADVDHSDNNNRTSLLAAASMGHSEVVSLLLFWGAAVDSIDSEGRTVLSVAAAQGNTEVVRQLLDRGLDEMHRDNAGWTPLHYSAFEGHKEVCELLIEAGARVCEVDNEGKIALILAAQEGHSAVIKTLIDGGCPVDLRSHDGKTALRVAALEDHRDTVHLLLCSGADINYKDADGRSTLYLLALNCQESMTAFLLENGADVDSRDMEGRTPLHVTSWQGHSKIVELLLIHGASVNAVDNDQRTALQSAAWQGHTDIVKLLLEQGANVDHTCNQGATALCIAAQEGHYDVVQILLEFGANPDHADQFNRTAMRVACKNGHSDVVKLLEEFGGIQSNISYGHKKFVESNSTTSVTSLSTAETKVCSAVLGISGTGVFGSTFVEDSVGYVESDKHHLYISNQSSKSSSNLTSSTNKSATYPDGNINIETQCSTTSIGSGKSNKTADSLSFTQQLQQCSLNKNRPLNRILFPLSEPQSPPQSPVSDNQGSPPPTPPPRSALHSQNKQSIPQPQEFSLKSREETRNSSNDKFRRNGIVTNPNYMAVNASNIIPPSGTRNMKLMSNYDTPAPRPYNFSKKETPL
ncbi:Ankyrin repeat domain-containing protein 50 [Nymphon striatum]|nr:Ankyrin repeat domain-containing protein 50 [Nymphon striatum]